MDSGVPRGSTRDNGLRCANYAAIADVDPRVVGTLLDTLRDAGIAAYAAPTPGVVGGAMETRLPARPVDRLYVDDQQVDRAQELVAAEQGSAAAATPTDIDAAWQQVLASLQSPSAAPVPPWPVSEDVDPDQDDRDTDHEVAEARNDDDDVHFVPPPPPPFPRLKPATVAAIASIVVGLVILALQIDGGSLTWLAVIAILGGVASLVWRMRNGPPTDSGWDDGAVV